MLPKHNTTSEEKIRYTTDGFGTVKTGKGTSKSSLHVTQEILKCAYDYIQYTSDLYPNSIGTFVVSSFRSDFSHLCFVMQKMDSFTPLGL